jgi:flagellar hook-associated protein 3 FlgL
MEKAQREVSSGVRVNAPSDSPDDVTEILALRAALSRNAQIRTNLERVKSETATADTVLQTAVSVLERAAVLAVQGAGDMAEEGRAALAEEVRGLQAELVSLSAASQGNRYIFSGDADEAPCYRLNLAAPEGVDVLAAPQSTALVEHPTGVPFAVSRTAARIFDDRDGNGDPTERNAFSALHRLAGALEAGDQAGIRSALEAVRAAGVHVNGQLGFYGAVENRITHALTDAGQMDLRLQTALSDRQDADVVASILELQQVQTSYSAALQMRTAARRTSLFDYLK